MPLTTEEKALLIGKYEPHLVLRFLKDFGRQYIAGPIDPDAYIRKCGLWVDTDKDQPEKGNWGVHAAQAHLPNFEPGSLEPEPAMVGSKTRLKDALAAATGPGTSSAFLSLGGWLEQSPFEPIAINPDIPEVGLVTAETRNMLGHLHYGGQFWTTRASTQGVPVGDPFTTPPRYTAEAFDLVDLFLSPELQGTEQQQLLGQVNSRLGGDAYFLWYHYFFPTHDDALSRCEMITLLNALGVVLPDAKKDWFLPNFEQASLGTPVAGMYFGGLKDLIAALKEAGAHFSLPFASYLGDFVSVAVVVRAPRLDTGGPLPSPLDVPDELWEAPLYVGFGKKAYAVDDSETLGAQLVQRPTMQAVEGGDLDLAGLHPLVYVSAGTNDTYEGVGGDQAFGVGVVSRPRIPELETLCEVADVDNDTPVPHTGKKKRRYRLGVILGKLGAGAASGGGLGVLIAALAATLELIGDSDDDREPSLDLDAGSVVIPSGVEGNFVIRSEDMRSDFGDSDGTFTYWQEDTASMIVDPVAPPDWFRQPSLRFGVPCLADSAPFNHRSGKFQPEFLPVTIKALAQKLGEG